MEPELSVNGKVILLFAGVGFVFGLFIGPPIPNIIVGLGCAFLMGMIGMMIMWVITGVGIFFPK